jgi:hypothetical protein
VLQLKLAHQWVGYRAAAPAPPNHLQQIGRYRSKRRVNRRQKLDAEHGKGKKSEAEYAEQQKLTIKSAPNAFLVHAGQQFVQRRDPQLVLQLKQVQKWGTEQLHTHSQTTSGGILN